MLTEEGKAEITGFLGTIARWAARHPEDLVVSYIEGTYHTIIMIQPHIDDVGSFLGNGGSTISAIRRLLMMFAYRTRQKLIIELVPPAGSTAASGPLSSSSPPRRRREHGVLPHDQHTDVASRDSDDEGASRPK